MNKISSSALIDPTDSLIQQWDSKTSGMWYHVICRLVTMFQRNLLPLLFWRRRQQFLSVVFVPTHNLTRCNTTDNHKLTFTPMGMSSLNNIVNA